MIPCPANRERMAESPLNLPCACLCWKYSCAPHACNERAPGKGAVPDQAAQCGRVRICPCRPNANGPTHEQGSFAMNEQHNGKESSKGTSYASMQHPMKSKGGVGTLRPGGLAARFAGQQARVLRRPEAVRAATALAPRQAQLQRVLLHLAAARLTQQAGQAQRAGLEPAQEMQRAAPAPWAAARPAVCWQLAALLPGPLLQEAAAVLLPLLRPATRWAPAAPPPQRPAAHAVKAA